MLLVLAVAITAPLIARGQSAEQLKKAVVETGHLEFTRDVPIRYLTRNALNTYLRDIFERDYPRELSHKEAEFLTLMGYTRAPIMLRELRRQIILENAGGLYNEKTKELVALEEYRQIDMVNAMALVHELRHAIQDQRFNLAAILGDYSDFDDRRLAALAAIEGDATLVMIKQLGFDPDFFLRSFNMDSLLSLAPVLGQSSLTHAPAIIKSQLLMPYREGLAFSNSIFKQKSWPGVNRVLAAPPQSTAQILHPEKYFSGEAPRIVAMRMTPKGYTAYHSGVIGEYYLNALLQERAEDGGWADVASGWRGDCFTIFKQAERNGTLLAWKSLWSTEADAARFAAAFQHFLEKNFSVTLIVAQPDAGPILAGESAAGTFLLRQTGTSLFYARSADRQTAHALLSTGILE